MKHHCRTNNGMSAIEMVLVIIVVLLITIVGLTVYNHYDKTDAVIILQRQHHIDKYISNLTIQNYLSLDNSLNNQGYLTPSLYVTTQSLITGFTEGNFDSNPAYSKFICVDQLPQSYSYGTVDVSNDGNTATIPVNVYVSGSINSTPYTAYWSKTDGIWKLNNVTCSQDSAV